MHLVNSSQFDYVFQRPQKTEVFPIIVFGRLNFLKYPRIGFSIAKKNVRYAHERNRVKRLTRESFRLYQYRLPLMDFVVVIQRGIEDLNNYTYLKALEKIWKYHLWLVKNI